MSAQSIVLQCRGLGIELSLADGQLKLVAPKGVMTKALATQLKSHKAEIIELLTLEQALTEKGRVSTLTVSDFANASVSQDYLEKLIERYPGMSRLYRATPMQEGMLYHGMLDGSGESYTTQGAFDFSGNFDVTVFKHTWQFMVSRYDVFRSCFVGFDQPHIHQLVLDSAELEVIELDWSAQHKATLPQRLEDYQKQDVARGFDFAKPPLLRISLINLGGQKYRFILTNHHVLMDGWCLPIVFGEVMAVYQTLLAGQTPQLADAEPFENYVDWLYRQSRHRALAFWREQLKGISAPTTLMIDSLGGSTAQGDYRERQLALAEQTSSQLNVIAKQLKTTMNVLVQAAWALLLGRYSGESSVVFGATVSGRPAALNNVERMVGLFINSIPVRLDIDGTDSIQTFLTRLNQANLDRDEYSYLSLPDIQGQSEIPRGTGLFDSLVIFENYPVQTALSDTTDTAAEPGQLSVDIVASREQTNFALTITAIFQHNILALNIGYRSDRYSDSTIDRLLGQLQTLLEAMANDALATPVADLPYLPQKQLQQLKGFGEAKPLPAKLPPTMLELFEQHVANRPDNTAVIFGEQQLSYAQLNHAVDVIGARLQALGVGKQAVVAVKTPLSVYNLATFIAVMKSGAIYLPLDENMPSQRANRILTGAKAVALLVEGDCDEVLPEDCQSVDVLAVLSAGSDTRFEAVPIAGDDTAYLIYTSGSTGEPKGVAVGHAQLSARYHSWLEVYGLSQMASFLQASNLAFDVSVANFIRTMGSGATLVVCEKNTLLDPPALEALINRHRIEFIDLVPALLRMLSQYLYHQSRRLESVKCVVVGSDVWYAEDSETVLAVLPERAKLINAYGLTETVIDNTYYYITRENAGSGRNIIGKALDGVNLYVVDSDLRCVSIGVIGELLIGGDLAQGYFNQADLTAEKFIPWSGSDQMITGQRVYRSGDLVRWLEDGNLEFFGRQDHQVKLKGYRIEMGEVESAFSSLEDVREVVVTTAKLAAETHLLAYVVPLSMPLDQAEFVKALKSRLSDRLPGYMVPSAIIVMERFELTANGKIDRKTLPELEPHHLGQNAYVAPSSETEKTLCGLFAQVLEQDQVGIEDSFFDLGGHSLPATRLVSLIRETFKIEMPLERIFERPTVALLAKTVDGDIDRPLLPPLTRRPEQAPALASFAQQRLWVIDQMSGGSPQYNMPSAFIWRGVLDIAALNRAFSALVEHHQVLRTNLVEQNDQLLQQVRDNCDFELGLSDLSSLAESEQLVQLEQILSADAAAVFDLSHELMLKAQLVKLSEQRHAVLLNIHHIASDGWSVGVMMQQLMQLYHAFANGQENPLAPLPVQYADYAHWQRSWLNDEVLAQQLGFWREQLSGIEPCHSLGLDKPRPPQQTYNGRSHVVTIDRQLGSAVAVLAETLNVTEFMLLQSAFACLLQCHSNSDDIVMGTPVAGRNHHELEGLIGFFVNTLVLRNRFEPQETFRQHLARSKKMVLGAYSHQYVPFEMLVEALKPPRDPSYSPLFQLLFSLEKTDQGPVSAEQQGDFALEGLGSKNSIVKFDLELHVQRAGAELALNFNYNVDLFDSLTIERMAEGYALLLQQLCDDPDCPVAQLNILSTKEQLLLLDHFNSPVAGEYPLGLHQVVERQAKLNPKAAAVIDGSRVADYGQLNGDANRLARLLLQNGVKSGDVVALMLPRSITLYTAMLAILKVGAGYLPLAPDYPRARLEFMLEDSGVGMLLSDGSAEFEQLKTIELSPDHLSGLSLADDDIQQPCVPSQLAYVTYTSGSTGTPKGIQASHVNVLRLVKGCRELIDYSPIRTLQAAPVSFDAAVFEIWLPLLSGGSVVCYDQDVVEPDAVNRLVSEHQINTAWLTAGLFDLWVDAKGVNELPLKTLWTGGDVVSPGAVARFYSQHPSCNVVNGYGPSETVTFACCYPVPRDFDSSKPLPIGRPVSDTRLYVLSPQRQLLPLGAVGELYIGGDAVSAGYLNREQLNRECFVDDPFNDKGGKMYKTGDVVRWQSDGLMTYVGRVDNQIKVRGFRIELGEIETALAAIAEVKEAVVIATNQGMSTADKQLVAYVLPQKMADGEAREDLSSQLKVQLSEQLPKHMVPSRFELLDSFPLSVNGKVDRKALAVRALSSGKSAGSGFAAPQQALQSTLCQIWQAIIGVEHVGVHDNFFDIGGTSLLSIKVQRQINQQTQADISVTDLFSYPTIAELAAFIATKDQQSDAVEVTDEQFDGGGHQAIAVLSMACRFPDADSPEEFWQNLVEGRESIRFFSDEELLEAGVPAQLLQQPNYVKSGALVDGLEMFDAEYFGFTPREAEVTDPQQRLLFECAAEALERAGYGDGAQARNVGVYVSVGDSTYLYNNILAAPQLMATVGRMVIRAGTTKDAAATRLSYKLNLTGPAVSIDTACSSSLVAVHQACRSLAMNECAMALCGGASIENLTPQGYIFEQGDIVSPDGHCRAFDINAQGTRAGSGAGLVLLKRLSDAQADGDNIVAVIKGSATNNDGSSKVGYTAPSVNGQTEVIVKAMRSANVEPSSIGYVEAHGTGTTIGDPIELSALKKAFGPSADEQAPCAIGSVKSNIGHLDNAAGIAGLIKVVLALQHGQLPPSINFTAPNPALEIENSPFYFSNRLLDWPQQEGPRRAGVSSFGIGGTNAHVVLESVEAHQADSSNSRRSCLLNLSANCEQSLTEVAGRLALHLQNNALDFDLDLDSVAYTLNVGRTSRSWRRSLLCSDIADAVEQLAQPRSKGSYNWRTDPEKPLKLVFMFPGQGSQYLEMTKDIYQQEPLFKACFDECANLLAPHLEHSLKALVYPSLHDGSPPDEELLNHTRYAQPALFAVEYALAKLLQSYGLQPDMMIGHSIGQYVAACLAGVFSLEDALKLVSQRGRLMQSAKPGDMLSVSCELGVLQPLLAQTGTCLAAVNGHSNCVAAGETENIAKLQQLLTQNQIDNRLLHTSHAFHSHMMEPVLAQFAGCFEGVQMHPPKLPFVCNISGDIVDVERVTEPGYWTEHIRQAVAFHPGIEGLCHHHQLAEDTAYVEVGPGTQLTTLLRKHQQLRQAPLINLTRHPREDQADDARLYQALGQLWCHGCKVDWAAFHAGQNCRTVDLPSYPFNRKRYWVDGQSAEQPTAVPGGKMNKVRDWFYLPRWQQAPFAEDLAQQSLSDGPETWLMFVDELGAGEAIANVLSAQHKQVIRVSVGDSFVKQDAFNYRLKAGDEQDASALFDALENDNLAPGRILYLWALNGQDKGDFEQFETRQKTSFDGLLALVKALSGSRLLNDADINILGNGLYNVSGFDRVNPDNAALASFAIVLPQEFPEVRCSLIDLDSTALTTPDVIAEAVVAEVLLQQRQPVVALRNGTRWLREFERGTPSLDNVVGRRIEADGVYLITGGMGQIGLVFADYLCGLGAKVMLLGRSAFPSEQQRQGWLDANRDNPAKLARFEQFEALLQGGACIESYGADVTDVAQMQAVVEQIEARHGPLQGVIHGAANLAGSMGMLQQLTAVEYRNQYLSKVKGALVLEQLLAQRPQAFCLLMSSISTVLGGLGFCAYTAANLYLDSFAEYQHQQGSRRWFSVAWDGWEIDPQGPGSNPLSYHLHSDEGHQALARVLQIARTPVLLNSTGDLSARMRKWRQPDEEEQQSSTMTLHERPNLQTDYVAPSNEVEEQLVAIWQELLGIEQIGVEDNFFELGGDSLLVTRLMSAIRKGFDSRDSQLQIDTVYDSPTIKALAEKVLSSIYLNKIQSKQAQMMAGDDELDSGFI